MDIRCSMVLPRTPIAAGRVASATFRGFSASLDAAHVHAPRQPLHTVPACNPPAILAAPGVARPGIDGRAGRRGFSSLSQDIWGGGDKPKPKPKPSPGAVSKPSQGGAAGGRDGVQGPPPRKTSPDARSFRTHCLHLTCGNRAPSSSPVICTTPYRDPSAALVGFASFFFITLKPRVE